MPEYVCELCKDTFYQKGDLTKHKNRKTPCIPLKEITNMVETKIKNDNEKAELINIFNYCMNVLRDNEHLIGNNALRTLANLLTLKSLEDSNKLDDINFENYDGYIFDDIDDTDENINIIKKNILKATKFSNLFELKDDNIKITMDNLYIYILSVHPKTKDIFTKSFGIERPSTYKKIFEKLKKFTFDDSKVNNDIQGDAYQEILKSTMVGTVLGQHFTPPIQKNVIIDLVNPKVHKNGTIETIFDPAMGTGGFLISSIKHLKKQANNENIKLDWNFINTKGIGGNEVESDTYQLAKANMLISTGNMIEGMKKDDTIRNGIDKKYDVILANPPFGIKGLTYDDFYFENKEKCFPIITSNAVPLFIQLIIHILKIGGRAGIVLPNGKELFKTEESLSTIRELLMKTCDLKEIIYFSGGIYSNTGVATCVAYFIKKKEIEDTIKINKIIGKKTNKETNREYVFSKTLTTQKVAFYDYNGDTNEKKLLIEVPIDEIIKNHYSLNYSVYMKQDEEKYEEGVIIKTLGEIASFLPKSKKQASFGLQEGLYPFYTSSQSCTKYCQSYDYEDECLIIGTGGYANIKYSKQFSCSTDNFIIKIIGEHLIKYIYYYLSMNIEILQKGFKGVGIKHISKDYIRNIKIPIPPIEKQNEIVKYLENNNNLIKQLEKQIEYNKEQAKLFMANIIKINNTEEIKFKIVEYKDTEYILEDNIMYKIKEDNGVICKGSKVGTWNDGKVKKGIKKDTIINA